MPDEAVQRLDEGRRLLDEGDLEGAVSILGPLTGHPNPDLAGEAWLSLATARYRADDEPGALAAWQAAARTDGAFAWLGWRSVAEQLVRDGQLAAAIEAYREAERRAPGEERGAIANRLGWLLKETGHDFAARRQFNRARLSYGAYPPSVTYAIVALSVGAYIVDGALGGGGLLGGGGGPLTEAGAVHGRAVAAGEYWRILTSAFLHLGAFHILFNMYALWLFGPIVERMYGHIEFTALYVLCAAGGSVLTILVDPDQRAVGASGALFGLFGLVFVIGRRHRVVATGQTRAVMSQVGTLLLLNLVFTFVVPSISWTGHVGGLLVGGLIGFLLPPSAAATLSAYWRSPSGEPMQRRVPAAARVATYAAVVALLTAGGIFAVTAVA
jgi:membrane associated rhomboid family serine protease